MVESLGIFIVASIITVIAIIMLVRELLGKKLTDEFTNDQQELRDACIEFLAKLEKLVPPEDQAYVLGNVRNYVRSLHGVDQATPTYDNRSAR